MTIQQEYRTFAKERMRRMENIFTAKTVEEAIELACDRLGVEQNELEIEVVEKPQKKLFGGYKGEAKIKVTVISDKDETDSGVSSENEANVSHVKTSVSISNIDSIEKIRLAKEYVTNVLKALGIEKFEINSSRGEDDTIVLDIVGDKLGTVIGRRGETLDSLQYLAILASNRQNEPYLRISLDCNGYREKRKETLEKLAERTSAKVLKQCRRVTLEPMNPYERRVIHSKVSAIEGVTSHSTGDEPYRRVVISSIAKPQRSDRRREGSSEKRTEKKEYTGNTTSYQKSKSFSTSFEREYKREKSVDSTGNVGDFSKETVEQEKSAKLYGKIEL